ncbi:MAG: 3-phosphoglycerate dehydrogenase, partial [Clostridiales bacterium]|nr:3-phosphoglycerate dehydrogenase [Clostridiales bacterium]
MRILVTDGMDKTAMAELREMGHEVVEQFYEPDQLGKALRDFDVVVVRSKTKVRANHIDEAKGSQLKLIIRGGVGVDNIDVDYAKANGIDVKNTPKASSQSVAELAMGHMFSCARYISIAGHTMREDKWEKKAYGKGIELQGKTLGIVGFGRIGQHLGVMAKAIGMKVVAFDIFHIPGIEEQLGIPYVEMDELLAMSDFVSV